MFIWNLEKIGKREAEIIFEAIMAKNILEQMKDTNPD